jgi:hypothetical protein
MTDRVGHEAAFEHYRQVGDQIAYFDRDGNCVFTSDEAGVILNLRGNFLAMHGAWQAVTQRYDTILWDVHHNPGLEDVVTDLAVVKTGVISLDELNGMLFSSKKVMQVCSRLHRNAVRSYVSLMKQIGAEGGASR